MVEQLGGSGKVAEHYKKSDGWVTQQMYLLKLVPELQQLVSSGELPMRETRALAKLPPDQQVAAWRDRVTEREEEKSQPRPARRKKVSAPETEPTVKQSQGAKTFTAVKNQTQPDPAPQAQATPDLPVPRPPVPTEKTPRTLPYDDGMFVAQHLAVKMDDEAFFLMLKILLEKGQEKDPAALARVLQQMTVDAG
jgi:ParB family chromosome partitioning protein